MSTCICPLTGFCTVRQVALKVTYQMICRENKSRIDKILLDRSQNLTTVSPSSVAVATKLLTTLETTTGVKVSCSKCLEYLATLNTKQVLDCDEIIANLAVVLPLPSHIRETFDTQQKRREWLKPIVDAVLLEWVDSADAVATVHDAMSVNSSQQ